VQSSKHLQSSGWSRGFLNRKQKGNGSFARRKELAERKQKNGTKAKVSFSGQSKPPANKSSRVTFSTCDSDIDYESDGVSLGGSSTEKRTRVSFTTADSEVQIILPEKRGGTVAFAARDDDMADEGGMSDTASVTSAASSRSRVSFTSSDWEIEDAQTPLSSPPNSAPNSPKPSKVTFSGEDDFKEIPRIGRSKVPPRPAAPPRGPAPFVPAMNDSGVVAVPDIADPFSQAASVPFDDVVFRGVVRERDDASGVPRDSLDGVVASAPGVEGGSIVGGGKKKLSRFAQRRLRGE